MVTSLSSEDHQPRSSTLMVKGLVGGWRLSSTAPVTGQRLRPTPHWRSGSFAPSRAAPPYNVCSKWVLGFFAFEASSELVLLVAIGGQEEERERWR